MIGNYVESDILLITSLNLTLVALQVIIDCGRGLEDEAGALLFIWEYNAFFKSSIMVQLHWFVFLFWFLINIVISTFLRINY